MQEELLKILPYFLKNEINNEYNNKVSQLNYAMGKNIDPYWARDIDLLKDLIFLGIFYRRIIAPIHGTAQFSYKIIEKRMNGVKIGSRKLSKKETDKLYHIYKKFESIMKEYHLSVELFDYDTIDEFLSKARILKELE